MSDVVMRQPAEILQELEEATVFGGDRILRLVWEIIDDVRGEYQHVMETAAMSDSMRFQVDSGVVDYLTKTYR